MSDVRGDLCLVTTNDRASFARQSDAVDSLKCMNILCLRQSEHSVTAQFALLGTLK